MSTATKKEYINLLRERYEFTSRKQRQRILDELCTSLGYHRKHAIRLLNSTAAKEKTMSHSKRGRKNQYADPLILEVIIDILRATNLLAQKDSKPYCRYGCRTIISLSFQRLPCKN